MCRKKSLIVCHLEQTPKESNDGKRKSSLSLPAVSFHEMAILIGKTPQFHHVNRNRKEMKQKSKY